MSTVTGIIEDIKSSPTKNGGLAYRVKLSGNWYGHGFKAVEFPQGTQVQGVVEQRGDFMNIKNLTLASGEGVPVANTAPAPQQPSYSAPAPQKPAAGTDWAKKDRQIMKQNAVTNANAYWGNRATDGEYGVQDVIDVAQKFYDWYTEE